MPEEQSRVSGAIALDTRRHNTIGYLILMLPVTAVGLIPSISWTVVRDGCLSRAQSGALKYSNSGTPGYPMRSARFDATVATDQNEKPSDRNEKTSEQAYKNIQILKDLPQAQLGRVMDFMSAALGVNCSYCHVVDGGNWAWEKDNMKSKRDARRMMSMTRQLNADYFGRGMVVNCATCHQGRTQPTSFPPPGQEFFRRANSESAAAKSSKSLPPVDQILDRYDRAIGGKAAFEKLNTRIVNSSLTTSDGMTLLQQVYMKAPNKMLITTTSFAGGSSQGFDGKTGWSKDSQGQRVLSGGSLSRLKLIAAFNSEIRLREMHTNLSVTGKERAGEHMAYVVEAVPTADDQEKFYFDVETGLLVRKVLETRTALGPLVDQTDYGDYREVDGIRMPFTLQRSSLRDNYTQKVVVVIHNTPIEDTRFEVAPGKQ